MRKCVHTEKFEKKQCAVARSKSKTEVLEWRTLNTLNNRHTGEIGMIATADGIC